MILHIGVTVLLKEESIPQSWLKRVGKERIQDFQDAFARLFDISLCLVATTGRSLTIWSNSALFCYEMIRNNKERCMKEKQNAIQKVLRTKRPEIFTCYMGLTYFMCPIIRKREVICLVYGGGIILDTGQVCAVKLNYSVPQLGRKRLDDIIHLLAVVSSFLECGEEVIPGSPEETEELPLDLIYLKNKLSQRELDIARLIYAGLPNKQIAEKLIISEKTVKTHVSNILAKLELKDRTQIILLNKR